MAKSRQDWELTAAELAKRMKRWKPKTLVNRLRKMGIEPFAPSTMKKLRKNSFVPSAKTLTKLSRQYVKAVNNNRDLLRQAAEEAKRLADELLDNIDDVTHFVGHASHVTRKSGWQSLADWLSDFAADKPEFNEDFSYIRLYDHGFRHVYQSGKKVLFTTKQSSGDPPKDMQPPVPLEVIYMYELIEQGEISSWMQVSQSIVADSNPLSNAAIENMQHQTENYQRNVDEMAASPQKSKFAYTWLKTTEETNVIFIGIGVDT